jgi:hypothetical protein
MLKNRIPQVQKILQFEIKITEIPQEKWSNTAIPQTPLSPLWCHPLMKMHSHNQRKINFIWETRRQFCFGYVIVSYDWGICFGFTLLC